MASRSKTLPFYWIDAFTSRPLGGNPCAVVLDAEELSAETMQSIAKETNLSETAFVFSSTNADFGARYFTPEEELPFAGHPTLSVVRALLEAGRIVPGATRVELELPAGIIPVEVDREGSRTRLVMSQLAPKFLRTYRPEEILPLFGLAPDDLLADAPIETVSTGTPILMIPLASADALRKARHVDPEAYFALKAEGDFFYTHHFCLSGATARGRTFARSLGSPPNGLEDPFTGSSTGCMAAYLWRHGLIGDPRFVAEQGHWMGRPGEAEVEVVGPSEAIRTVRLGGEAVCLIRGQIDVPDRSPSFKD